MGAPINKPQVPLRLPGHQTRHISERRENTVEVAQSPTFLFSHPGLLAGDVFKKKLGVVSENKIIPLLGRPGEKTTCGLRIGSCGGGPWARVRFGC